MPYPEPPDDPREVVYLRRPATIQLALRHLTSDEVETVWRSVHLDDGSDLADNLAVTIASWWQSPGRPGRELAALASGAPVSPEDLAEDVAATIAEGEALGTVPRRDLDLLRWLASWVEDWSDR